MSVDSQLFRRTLGSFPSGVTVITSHDTQADSPIGVTVSAFSSVSLDPPLVLFCLDNRSTSLDAIKSNGHFAVNILGQDQTELSNLFASKAPDKWSGVSYRAGAGQSPVLDGTSAFLECAVHSAVDGGDHTIFIGRVQAAGANDDISPLLYCRGSYAKLNGGNK